VKRACATLVALLLAFLGVAPAVLAMGCPPGGALHGCCSKARSADQHTIDRDVPSCCRADPTARAAPSTQAAPPDAPSTLTTPLPLAAAVSTLAPVCAALAAVAPVAASPPPRSANGPPLPLRI
jgi:hypothetical protein